MAKPRDDESEYAVMETALERAVTRSGKGRNMAKALLLKKWGSNYAGQVLTNVQEGSIPSGVARFYKDDEPSAMDVVKDPDPGLTPMRAVNDEMDSSEVDAADEANASRVKAGVKALAAATGTLDATEDKDTQRRAKEADKVAAKAAKSAGGGEDKRMKTPRAKAGKEHGVK